MQNESLVARVARTIENWQMLSLEDSVLVGVSGGADSVCLVRVLSELGFQPGIAHVNHGWRGTESDGDAGFVRELAADFGLPFFEHGAGKEPTPGNLEAWARETRRRFFSEVMEQEGFQKLALAHSRDDRSETFLLHLLRGSGARGLASMRAVSGTTVRPLLETTRAEIETYLGEIGQTWRQDRTNADTRFARNRIRHTVLPNLAGEFNPNLPETLARTAEILDAEDNWMETAAEQWLEPRVSHCGKTGEGLVVDIRDLPSQPVALVRRVLRTALRQAGSSMRDIGFGHLESVRSLLQPGKSGKTIQLPGELEVERNFDTLNFHAADSAPDDYQYELSIPGCVRIPEIGMLFEAHLRPPEALKPKQERVFVDGESLGPCVKIRNWHTGDSYCPAGGRTTKLKELFRKERIPRRRRPQWPVIVARSSIVWVASFPVSRDFAATEKSRRIIEFEAVPSARVT